jgi:hypothetical protein
MSRKFPQALVLLVLGIICVAMPQHSFAAAAPGGACPTGTNYLSLTSPQTGGGQGSVTLASLGVTSCYYISAAGSDSSTGTDEGHPWLHAPGMPACTSNCAASTPAAGNGFIFRGGGTWHRNTGSPQLGGDWVWGQSGSGGNPIYIGVDLTWFSGGSFTRPTLNEDNPITTSEPSGCPYPDDGATLLSFSGRSNVIVDAFEFLGACWSGGAGGMTVNTGNFTIAERLYMHGWSVASSASDDNHDLISNSNSNSPNSQNRKLFLVIDGSDSTFGTACTSPSCVGSFGGSGGATGYAIGDCWDVEYSVVRHASQGMECGDASIVHDNLFEYLFEPSFGGRHGNVFEVTASGYGSLCSNLIAYNNITRNTNEGVNWWPQCPNYYIFNNVWENSGHYPPDPNGLMLSPPGPSGSSIVTAYVFNNTFQANQAQAGPANSSTPAWASGSTITFGNNHIMDFTSTGAFFNCSSGDNCSMTDSGGEVFQTTSAANAQGYTLSNDYAPTSSGDATVNAGKNSSSFCSGIPNAVAAAACSSATSGGVLEQSGWGGKLATYPAIPVIQRSGSWDAGAYEFGSSNVPSPPTGLAVQIQ